VGFAFADELATAEVEDADNSKRASNSKVLVVVTYSNRVELVRFTFEWAAFKDELSISLA